MDKIAVVFVASIFALTGIAAGYAMWSQDLTIAGEVHTGIVDWEFLPGPSVQDTSAPPPYYPPVQADWNCDPDYGFFDEFGIFVGWYQSDKNVGWGYAEKTDQHTIKFELYNVYPGYYNHIDWWVHGLGTIPIKIDSVTITDALGNQIGYLKEPPGSPATFAHLDIDGDTVVDTQIMWGDHWGTQLEHCETADMSFGICFLQPLAQNQQITIYIHIRAIQWNEYVVP